MHADSQEETRAYSSNDGRYKLAGLPAGDYSVEVATPCCTFKPYASEAVAVDPDVSFELDIVLKKTENLIALADDPGALANEVLRRRTITDQPVSKLAANPDLSGIWLVEDDPFPDAPEPLPWAENIVEQRDPNNLLEDPAALCLPGELPIPGGSIPIITRFLHTPDLLVMLFEGPPGFRQVFLDGRGHPAHPNPSWLGHSVGHWDGATLVIDTIGFNASDLGLNGDYPRSETMHLEERYTRTGYGYMDLLLTIDDPGVFKKPWVRNLHLDLVPQEELIEFVCENNKWVHDEPR